VEAAEVVGFRHELIRRVVEESLTSEERESGNRAALKMLSDETDPARIVHHASAARDIERLIEAAPRAAEAAAAVGSHREAIAHYRTLEPYLDRLEPDARGIILDSWGNEQMLVADYDESIRVQQLRVLHHRERGDHRAESAALVAEAFSQFTILRLGEAKRLTRRVIEVLGSDAAGPDLVPVFEFNAYMAMMSLDFAATRQWVNRTLEAAGPDADETLIIRCLNHRGSADSMRDYPAGKDDLDEAARRAEAIGNWREVSRALHNLSFAADEGLDLSTALEYAQRSVAAATREDVPGRLAYAELNHAWLLWLAGSWDEAEQVAREALTSSSVVFHAAALPILGTIDARKGRPGARTTLTEAWDTANEVSRYQDLTGVAAALAEYAWITGDTDIPIDDIKEVMRTGMSIAPGWRSLGSIVFWLWELGELDETPEGIAEPYRLIIDRQPRKAADRWAKIGAPYEQAIALSHGPPDAQLQALEILDDLGATAVAAKLGQQLRDQGVTVPRGKDRFSRDHAAGLTARQAEVLELLAEGLSNLEIADRLFVSPRTAENHVFAVLSKLDVTTRQDAVTQARTQGFLTPD
jgi:DNA-binding CsgD family transcriptional regulator